MVYNIYASILLTLQNYFKCKSKPGEHIEIARMVLFDWQYFQFNMIVLGDILRMIILFIQCGLRVSTHDDFHVLNEVSFYINNLSHEWRGKKFY